MRKFAKLGEPDFLQSVSQFVNQQLAFASRYYFAKENMGDKWITPF